ncbi:MAG: glutamine--tRNA ligase, partial [Thermodesulfobacteriota bacterium]
MGVLNPVKVVITNYPEADEEELDAVNNPEDESQGTRKVPFSKELYIERDDFMEEPPKNYFRLFPGSEVRLRYAYFVKCVDFKKDGNTGEISEIHCTYDPETKGGDSSDGRKIKGTLHWVSAKHAINAEIRLYDRLFTTPNPDIEFTRNINHNSLEILNNCYLEPFLNNAEKGVNYQFERLGYFILDSKDSTSEKPVFNRTVTLRDSWVRSNK